MPNSLIYGILKNILFERIETLMTKNTHLATGLAISTAVLMPNNLHSLAVCITGAAIGSTISDIDVASSKPRKELNTIVSISVIAITALIVLEFALKIGIYKMLESQADLYRVILGFVIFLLLSIYGTTTKHRSYTHSLIGLVSFSGAIGIMFPKMIFPFSLGFISHILLDIFNTKKVRLLYPNKKFGIALKLCHSDGKANTVICTVSTIIFTVELILFLLFKMNLIHFK